MGGKESGCYFWPCYTLLLCVWDFRYTLKLPGVQLLHVLLASLTSENVFDTTPAYTREMCIPKQQQSNSPLSQAFHEDHLCQCLLGDLWVLVALEVQGVQLVLGPPKPIKNSSKICFRGTNHIKTHQFTHKECKASW